MWKAVPISIFSHLGRGLDILTHTCNPNEIRGLPRNAGHFWPTVLKTWLSLKMKNHEHTDHNIYLDSPLWNNENFKYKNNILHLKDWATRGIHSIRDILNDNNEIRPFQKTVNIVGQTAGRLLEYKAIKTTLLQAIERNRLHNTYRNEDTRYLTFNEKPLHTTCRDWRKAFSDETISCAVNFWNRKLNRINVDINQDHWEATFNATKETRLRVLQ